MKSDMCQEIVKIPNINVHSDPFGKNLSCSKGQTDGQAATAKVTVAFRNYFANVPNIES